MTPLQQPHMPSFLCPHAQFFYQLQLHHHAFWSGKCSCNVFLDVSTELVLPVLWVTSAIPMFCTVLRSPATFCTALAIVLHSNAAHSCTHPCTYFVQFLMSVWAFYMGYIVKVCISGCAIVGKSCIQVRKKWRRKMCKGEVRWGWGEYVQKKQCC